MNRFIPLSINKYKSFLQLTTKKGREKSGFFIIEGKKLFQEAIRENLPIHSIIIHEKRQEYEFIFQANSQVYVAKDSEFKKLSSLENSEGILAILPHFHHSFPNHLDNSKFFILDQIQDPGNLGTIFRICDAFNIQGLILHQCVEVYNPKVVRASMGAIFRIPFYQINVREIIKLYSHKIIKTELYGIPLNKVNLDDYQFIVLGNEANGIISEWNQEILKSISIPQSGKAESLNVGIACGILAWEWTKTQFSKDS